MNADNVDESGEDSNPRRMAALTLARQGFYVLPVDRKDKLPDSLLAPNGFKNASRDPEVIGGWFDVKPKDNIGIACGADYGLVVLDVDCKNGARGMETLQTLDVDPMTLTATSPSGGYHLYYKHPGVPLKAKLDGIDIKGAAGGGYVLAPPSALPQGGYTWKDADVPVAGFPQSLLKQLLANGQNGHAEAPKPKGPVASIKVPQGKRHERLIELGAIYRGKGLSAEDIEVLLWNQAQHHFTPPFSPDNPEDAREVEDVVHWFNGKGTGQEAPASLEVLDTAELRNRAKADPVPHLLSPVLPAAGSLMIYGSAGIGKSHIGLCVAGALARGASFLDWTAAEAVTVLYVDGEMPLDELDTRIAGYFGEDELPRLKWIAARAQDSDLPNLADAAAQEMYLAAIIQTDAKVAVFDNLSCLRATSSELPENSVEAWQPVGAFIRRLNRLGVAVILVHHASKAGQQRGSTAHVAPMDTVIALHALGEGQADPLAENDVEVAFEKHRRFSGEAAQTFRAKAIGDADGHVSWQRVGADPLVDDIVRLQKEGKSIREMASITGRSKAAIEKARGRAKARGLLPLGSNG